MKTLLLVLLPILFAKIIDNNFWHSVGFPKLKFCIYFSLKFQYKSKISQWEVFSKNTYWNFLLELSKKNSWDLKVAERIIELLLLTITFFGQNYWLLLLSIIFWRLLLLLLTIKNYYWGGSLGIIGFCQIPNIQPFPLNIYPIFAFDLTDNVDKLNPATSFAFY